MHRASIQVNWPRQRDVTIDMVLTASSARSGSTAPELPPKITHCTLINEELLRRIKAIGRRAGAVHLLRYYNSDKFRFYGEALMQRSMAYRSFADAGIPAAAGWTSAPARSRR